jgi:hypothetical protein
LPILHGAFSFLPIKSSPLQIKTALVKQEVEIACNGSDLPQRVDVLGWRPRSTAPRPTYAGQDTDRECHDRKT